MNLIAATKYPNGTCSEHLELEGIQFKVDRFNRVYWMDDWCSCWTFKRRGIFRSVTYDGSTYGHTDFYLNL